MSWKLKARARLSPSRAFRLRQEVGVRLCWAIFFLLLYIPVLYLVSAFFSLRLDPGCSPSYFAKDWARTISTIDTSFVSIPSYPPYPPSNKKGASNHGGLHHFIYLSTPVAANSLPCFVPRLPAPTGRGGSCCRPRGVVVVYRSICCTAPTATPDSCPECRRCLSSSSGRRRRPKARDDGYVFAWLSCFIPFRRPRQGLEFPYHWSVSAGHELSGFDFEGMSYPGIKFFISLIFKLTFAYSIAHPSRRRVPRSSTPRSRSLRLSLRFAESSMTSLLKL